MNAADGPAEGSVKGQAMSPPEVRDALLKAWQEVQHIDRNRAVLKREYMHGRTVYHLDPALVEGLTAVQKVVLAHGGVPDWGGYVTGSTVSINID